MVKLFLSGVWGYLDIVKVVKPKYVLVSYYELKDLDSKQLLKGLTILKESSKEIMLDSGGYTFIMDVQKRGIKLSKEYLDNYYSNYLSFLEKWGKFFRYKFELDLDLVAGQKWVDTWFKTANERGLNILRVFHKRQGIDVLKKYLKEDSEMIGAPIRREYKRGEFLKIAKYINDGGKKFHGLAYTPRDSKLLYLPYIYSVDSTSWLSSAKFGEAIEYTDGYNIKTKDKLNLKNVGWKLLVKNGMNAWARFAEVLDNGN